MQVVEEARPAPDRLSVIRMRAESARKKQSETDALILSYIHKKFGSGKWSLPWGREEERENPAKRRSVIVMNSSVRHAVAIVLSFQT